MVHPTPWNPESEATSADPRAPAVLAPALRREAELDALAGAIAVTDPLALSRLHAAGVRAESAAALAMVPFVEVAWADGRVAPPERSAVTSLAEALRLPVPALRLLERWLAEAPDHRLFTVWERHLVAEVSRDEGEDADRLERRLYAQARTVALAAGGRFGVGRICSRESLVLRRIERACQRALRPAARVA